MCVQYCDHYLPVNSADPSLKNFRAAIVVLRWTCYVLSRSFSSAFLAWPCHVTKITLRTFLAWLCHMIKILRCARAWQKLPSWARGTKFQLLVFCNVMLHRSKMSSLFFILESTKKIARSNRPFHSRMHRLHVHCWKRIWWRGKCRQLHSFLLPSG